jgi:chromosomal replication initiator protein
MEPLIPMIQKKYQTLIENCLSESEGKAIKILILGKNEADRRLTRKDTDGEDDTDPHLNSKYTFETFVPGDSNRFAFAAALAAAENPGDTYNPLFIYGGVGLGKTHLMQAIGNRVHQEDPSKRILYMTSETFMNEMINAIQQKNTYEFRAKLRKVDVLLVDDVQFIAGREATQQEFFNMFNELHGENKQIVLTSDKPPKDIQRLEERLCSRFEWGLVADIQAPDEETRAAILREKIRQEKYEVPDEVVAMIAREIKSNVRELEGGLNRLVAYSNLTGNPITLELSETALREIIDSRKVKIITAEMIMQSVSDYYNVTLGEMIGPTRKREITIPRQVAIYLTREMTGMSLPQIGSVFGGRDHTTIMHSCKVMENTVREDPGMKSLVNSIKRQIESAR